MERGREGERKEEGGREEVVKYRAVWSSLKLNSV